MTKYLTGRFSKTLMLLVGVCLIGTAFHLHQLHPDYTLQDSTVPQHLSVDQPDCVACMHLVQAGPVIYDSGDIIRHESMLSLPIGARLLIVDQVSTLNNKSPPPHC